MDEETWNDLMGRSNLTPEQREARGRELLKQVEVDHVISNGKVYLSAEGLSSVLDTFSRVLAIRALVMKDTSAIYTGLGVEMVADVLTQLNGEFLRREAENILAAKKEFGLE